MNSSFNLSLNTYCGRGFPSSVIVVKGKFSKVLRGFISAIRFLDISKILRFLKFSSPLTLVILRLHLQACLWNFLLHSLNFYQEKL